MSSTRHTERGTSPRATTLPRTFRRRSAKSEPALARKGVHASQEVACRKPPEIAQGEGQLLRRDRASLPGTLGVARNVREHVHVRDRDDLGDELGGYRGETPLPALLPGTDERPRAAFVHEGGARAREREPAPRAFGAALHGPGAGRAAALADRGAQSDEGVATGLAESGAGPPADRAARRKEQLEHHVIVGRYSLRLCEKMRSASWSVSAEPMSYHCPGSRQV